MLLQLKVNASSIPSTLGKGKHGYMGVILSLVTYATLDPIQSFVLPDHPGILQFVHPATYYEIFLAKTLHNESIRPLQSYQLIQHALVQQVSEAVDGKYLRSLRNHIMRQVLSDIRDLILSLFCV